MTLILINIPMWPLFFTLSFCLYIPPLPHTQHLSSPSPIPCFARLRRQGGKWVCLATLYLLASFREASKHRYKKGHNVRRASISLIYLGLLHFISSHPVLCSLTIVKVVLLLKKKIINLWIFGSTSLLYLSPCASYPSLPSMLASLKEASRGEAASHQTLAKQGIGEKDAWWPK